jgi:hypothetical protein
MKLEKQLPVCLNGNKMPGQIIDIVPSPLAELQVLKDHLQKAQEILP